MTGDYVISAMPLRAFWLRLRLLLFDGAGMLVFG